MADSLIVAFGEMLIDFVPDTSGVSLAESTGFLKAPGGAPANVACAITKLGGKSAFVGKVRSGSRSLSLYYMITLDYIYVCNYIYFIDIHERTLYVGGRRRVWTHADQYTEDEWSEHGGSVRGHACPNRTGFCDLEKGR